LIAALQESNDEESLVAKYKHEISLEALMYMFGGGNPKVTPEDERIVEGDIVLPNITDDSNELNGRKAVKEPLLLWPLATVPYTYHYSITDDEKRVIEMAIEHWQNETCLRFKPRTMFDYYFVRFRSDRSGCWSLLGRQPIYIHYGQDISIGKGCAEFGVVTHEIGHVIGFYHEQSRSDRDIAIHINWENVEKKFTLQFEREIDINYNVGYDYTSIMQYPSWAFSKAPFEKNSVVTLDPRYQRLLAKNNGLSFRDKKIANHLYACNKNCPNRKTTECLNEGYLKPYRNDGRQCECECPPTTTGKFCETLVKENYYDAIEPLPCGGNITQEGYIETPDYPQRLWPKQSCTWIVMAPSEKVIRLTFEGFEFAPRLYLPQTKAHKKCVNETVEVRLTNKYSGSIYCGNDITEGTEMISEGPEAIIIIIADKHMIGKGLRAKIEFIKKKSKNIWDLWEKVSG
ncbi:Zinc metalloproteinase dpy-31-like protein, partial [Dinothrombium tinctorium]